MSYVGNKPPQTTIPADDAVTTAMLKDDAVTTDKVADAINTSIAANTAKVTNATHTGDVTGATALTISAGAVDVAMLSASGTASSSTVLYGDGTWKAEPVADTTGLQDDIALLAFKTQANGSLAKYNLVDQIADAFEDASGVDASSSTNEFRSTGSKFYVGLTAGSTPATTTWTADTTWTVPTGVYAAEVLAVAGGGAGASCSGGGAGGVVWDTAHSLVPGASVTIEVGDGGARQTGNTFGPNGENSVFNTLIAVGGGGAGSEWGTSAGQKGRDGGSGGGTDHQWTGALGYSTQQTDGTPTGGTVTSYGNGGGWGSSANGAQGAGGGGAGAAGNGDGTQTGCQTGGAGIANSITGSSVTYGGGGGGSSDPCCGGGSCAGGSGGGGDAGENGVDGTDGLGGGGGACKGQSGWTAGGGGDGIVIAKYTPYDNANLTLVSTATTAESAPSKGDIVLTYTNGVGTATINTDLTAEFSADNGSTWTSMTLASQGTTGGHTILSAHDVTRTSTSGTSMRYRIKTLNQSALKETRIQAVSLGWSQEWI